MLQTLNCIRMGEVLFDENLQLFILCNNCHTDLRNLQDFRHHLEKCEGLENLFQQGRQKFKYNTDKCTQLFGKTFKGIKEFLIYDHNDVEVAHAKPEENLIDLINIEEELLDPKWYSDFTAGVTNQSQQKSSKQYDELVEAVTPFVQFKENLKTNTNGSNSAKSNVAKSSCDLKVIIKETEKPFKNVKFDLTANKMKSTAKRRLSISKSAPEHFAATQSPAEISVANNIFTAIPISLLSTASASKKYKSEIISNRFAKTKEENLTKNALRNTSMLPPANIPNNITLSSIPSKSSPTVPIKQEPTKEKQTAQILNKLQNLGLQVKRTQPLPQAVTANPSAPTKTDTKTLEILQRLQSKGMKVKILNKQQATDTKVNFPIPKPQRELESNPAHKAISVIRNSALNMAIKQNLNKNLIIKKVN